MGEAEADRDREELEALVRLHDRLPEGDEAGRRAVRDRMVDGPISRMTDRLREASEAARRGMDEALRRKPL